MTEAENERDCRIAGVGKRQTRQWALGQAQLLAERDPQLNQPRELLYIADRFTAFVLTGKVTDEKDAG